MTQISTQLSALELIQRCKTPKWSVIILNDDVTTMDFVVRVLVEIFDKSIEDAINLMLKIHNEGEAVAGVYSYEVARTRIFLLHQQASQCKYPLRARMEEIE